MADLSNVDSSNVADDKFAVIPAGWYAAVIVGDEVKSTKKGDGKYLKLKIQIVEPGKWMNRVVFSNLNLWNPNGEAVAIANAELKKICEAVNVPWKPNDSSVLHSKRMMVKLVVKEYDGNDQNEVRGFKAALPATSQQQPATATAGEKKAPAGWG